MFPAPLKSYRDSSKSDGHILENSLPSYSTRKDSVHFEKSGNPDVSQPAPLKNKKLEELIHKTNIPPNSPISSSRSSQNSSQPLTSNVPEYALPRQLSSSNTLPLPKSSSSSSQNSISSMSSPCQRPKRRPSVVNHLELEYQLLPDKVGEGAFGTVCRGRSLSTNQTLAIKCVKKSILRTGELKESIENEAMIHLNLNHPRIVHLYDVCDTDDGYYFIMDEVKGYTLNDRLNCTCDYPISEEEACHYTYEILQGLEYLHTRNIIHCDLKPENILLEDRGAKAPNDYIHYDVKLCDFGLSKEIPESPIKDKNIYIQLASTQGTMGYMAPEMFMQKRGTTSSDIWSVGILLFKMLFDYDPFYPYSSCATTDLEYDEYACSNVSPQAKAVVDHMLVREPFGRSSAKELLKMKWFDKERER